MNRKLMAMLVTVAVGALSACSTAQQPASPPAGATTSPAAAPTTSPADAPSTVTAGSGQTYTLTLQNLPNSRGFEYCELVFNYGDKGSDIYSTSPLAPCSEQWWDGLDLNSLATQFGAQSVTKNGPEYWTMDVVGVKASGPVQVAGVNMVYGANLPPGTIGAPQYTVFNPAKTQNLTWKAGQPTYRLTDTSGNVYVLQGNKVPTDQLATLGSQFKELPAGWTYTVVNPTQDLVMDLTPDQAIPSVQDEFDQIYIQIPQGS